MEKKGELGKRVESCNFGPTIQEVISISLTRTFFLEFGSFQLAHFGLKMLLSDIGITGGISVGF